MKDILAGNSVNFGGKSEKHQTAMDEAGGCIAASLIILLDEQRRQKKPKTNKGRIWLKNWISRTKLGAYHTLLKKLASEDISACKNYLRMDATTFEELLQKIAPIITKLYYHLGLAHQFPPPCHACLLPCQQTF